MADGSEDIGFPFEAFHDGCLDIRVCSLVDHFFNSNNFFNLEPEVLGSIYSTHASPANGGQDLIPAFKFSTWLEVFEGF